MRPVSGAAGAGCAALSLPGLLIGVAITVWLGSIVAHDVGGGGGGGAIKGSSGTTPATTVLASAHTGLQDGALVTVAGDDYPTGSFLIGSQCARRSGTDLGCDPATEGPGHVDLGSRGNVPVTVHRLIRVNGTVVDCRGRGVTCEIRIVRKGASTDRRTLPITFAADAKAVTPPPAPATTTTAAGVPTTHP